MDDYLKEALEIVKAQASVRNMADEDILAMLMKLANGIREIESGAVSAGDAAASGGLDPKKAIREKSIVCMESGKSFKILTKKHLAKFGLTPEEYRAKWGYSRNMPLVCKVQRERRKKMKEMKLWEKRVKKD